MIVRKPLAAIAAAVADYKLSPAERVSLLVRWLWTGGEPAQYRNKAEKERGETVEALERGQIKTGLWSNGRIAVVESGHRSATTVGYCLTPVVVALNPEFRQGELVYRKFTICAYTDRCANIKGALSELAQLESGWGGGVAVGGSPQGASSRLSVD